jgi:hypothetical protein
LFTRKQIRENRGTEGKRKRSRGKRGGGGEGKKNGGFEKGEEGEK